MPYKISCFVPGENSIFVVNIAEDSWVADLKNEIKEKKPARLGNIDANYLTLYRVEVDKLMIVKSAPTNIDECTKLDNAEQFLSDFFGKSPPEGKKYYILVQVPKGKSIHCGGIVLMTDAPSTTRIANVCVVLTDVSLCPPTILQSTSISSISLVTRE